MKRYGASLYTPPDVTLILLNISCFLNVPTSYTLLSHVLVDIHSLRSFIMCTLKKSSMSMLRSRCTFCIGCDAAKLKFGESTVKRGEAYVSGLVTVFPLVLTPT